MAAPKKVGIGTVAFSNPPVILATATIVGAKEGEGPLANTFEKVVEDPYYGEESWEKAERRMLQEVLEKALAKANIKPQDVDYLLAGDLLNQIISANFVARALAIPYIGLYGACSTIYEGLALGAMLIDGGFAQYVLIGSSSHYSTAERQYRFPTEQGAQRPLTAQWTVTGAGAILLAASGAGPRVTHATIGRVIDLGSADPYNMGAAMAPAAANTIVSHLSDTQRRVEDYDLILTGDLGAYGTALLHKLMAEYGHDITRNHNDCGLLIFDRGKQDVHAGGSGCACAAVVTCGYLMQQFQQGKLKRALGVGTGALLSPLTTQQGESIPAVGHAVVLQA
ncbi:stage V sporulation protein AD [Thermodesulfitimonas autotrophica]|uniref:Stage V sporulation protein AD n=1 Tax=Thermodesulfitimonas autotrophica TaxID=1894989 RepID=A0A3N5AWL6_9THEO|nr:stage V sporulation protein AD [Thermodesulfitimonas autotrophica]RPF49626.1 stage V sporulation protein AD [Thermodesulfitimonas autotrophica]